MSTSGLFLLHKESATFTPGNAFDFPIVDLGQFVARSVLSTNSPDPGVLLYKGSYYAVTTSGDDANAFPIHVYVQNL